MVDDSSVSSGNQASDTLQSTATEAVGKDVTEQNALSLLPAKTPALETTVY